MEDEEETDDDVPQEASNTVTPGRSLLVKSIIYPRVLSPCLATMAPRDVK